MEVNTTFDQIAQLIRTKNYTDLGPVPELQHLASEGNTIFTVVDKLGNRFTAEVYQNPETGDLQPPLMQQIPYLIELPPPILVGVVIRMSLPDVLRMCRTNTYLNANICENDDFWKQKFIHDFGPEDIREGIPVEISGYWKQRYQNFGRVWSFGNNDSGQLGLGDHGTGTNRNKPTLITGTPPLPPIMDISAKRFHSLMRDVNGGVWGFGQNYFGELGLGDQGTGTNRNKPTLITGTPPIKDISAGRFHSLILDINGGVWGFGQNHFGELGLGDHGTGTNRNKPTLMAGIPPIRSISAGESHSLLLDINGGAWLFGNNHYGRLGLGDENHRDRPTFITGIPPIKGISAGAYHSLILDVSGVVWSTGSNYSGQLGLGDHGKETKRNKFTSITDIPPIVGISAGGRHSLLFDINGGAWSFGNNDSGQLGLGDQSNRDKPNLITGTPPLPPIMGISSWSDNSLLLDVNRDVWSFGSNRLGQLGLGNKISRDKPTLISGIPSIRAVSVGGDYSLLISY